VLRTFAEGVPSGVPAAQWFEPDISSALRSHGEPELADRLVDALVLGISVRAPSSPRGGPQLAAAARGLVRAGLGNPNVPGTLVSLCTALNRELAGAANRPLAADDLFVLCTFRTASKTAGLPVPPSAEARLLRFLAWATDAGPRGLSQLSWRDIHVLFESGAVDVATRALTRRTDPTDPLSLAHAALCHYLAGNWEHGDRLLQSFERYTRRTSRHLRPEVAAAYLEANQHRVAAFFDRIGSELPSRVAADDGRAHMLIDAVTSGGRVLEVGCGKGRFLDAILRSREGVHCTGVDFSRSLVSTAPRGIQRVVGTLESIPCRDGCFDVVCSVEAIEHSANWPAAVRELIRVTRLGGTVIVIDKQWAAWGRLECPSWERWPHTEEFLALMRRGCDHVEVVPLSYDGHPADGLLVAWRGTRVRR
jgi:ubiquinone/menaquinone biosynthesis C-methylase UbiE